MMSEVSECSSKSRISRRSVTIAMVTIMVGICLSFILRGVSPHQIRMHDNNENWEFSVSVNGEYSFSQAEATLIGKGVFKPKFKTPEDRIVAPELTVAVDGDRISVSTTGLLNDEDNKSVTVNGLEFAGPLAIPEGSKLIDVEYDDGLGAATRENTGLLWYTVVPVLFVIISAFWTRQIMPSYLIAGCMTHYMVKGGDFFTSYFDTMFGTVMKDGYVWLVFVCGLMSALMTLISRSGGAYAFANWVANYVRGAKGVLMASWFLGLVMFVDDYLSCLAIGPSFQKLSDKYKISREKFSYVVDSIAAAPCVLLPISTWAVFIAGLYEMTGFVDEGEGMGVFVKTIPYSIYAWVAILIVPLVIYGIIPMFGPMKKAEIRAQGGQVAPEGSDKIEMLKEDTAAMPKNPKAMNLFIPLGVLIASTVYYDLDLFYGSLVATLFTIGFFLLQKIVTVEEAFDSVIEGFKSMMFLFVLVAFSYTFTRSLSMIDFAGYVVENIQPYMNPELMPFILFAVFGTTEFMTGSNWDLYLITFPVVLPLSMAIGADPILCSSAIISAGVFGSHVCIVSDSTLCTSAACGCDSYQHATTQIPYALIAAGITAVIYLAIGLM